MVLIKPFLTGFFLHDCFKLIYTYLHEGDKVRECYTCLKMMIQAHLHVGILAIFFIKRASLKQFYLYIKLLQSSTIFKIKKWLWSVLRLKFLHEALCNSQFKKYLCIVTIVKSELPFLLILYFHSNEANDAKS